MSDLSITAYEAMLKVQYPEHQIVKMTYEASPAFATIPKRTNFVGDYAKVPCKFGGTPAISARFATAQARRGHSTSKAFAVPRKKKYAVAGIDNETVLAAAENAGAVLDATKGEMKDTLEGLGHALSVDLFADAAAGQVGTVDITVACPITGAVCQLEDPEDAKAFEIGMYFVFAPNAASALRDSGKALCVRAVDRDLGRVTFDANLDTVTGLADGDLMFREGDYTAPDDESCIWGFQTWIPKTAPTSGDNLGGVDRSLDVTRLAGHRYSSTTHPGLSTEEAILLVAGKISKLGKGKPDICYIGFDRFRGLVAAQTSKVSYTRTVEEKVGKATIKIGVEALQVIGPKGLIDVVPDPCCSEDTLFVLERSSWEFKSLGNAPRPILTNGQWTRDQHDGDGIEIRAGVYGNLINWLPGHNGRYDF